MTDSAVPPSPERNLLRALHPATTEIHKALQRLILKSGGRYRVPPQVHDYDVRATVMSNPFRELNVKAILLFPWDSGTGQTLAEFIAYYRHEIPRRAPLSIVITATPLMPAEVALAEGVLESPICVLSLVDKNPNQLAWQGAQPFPPAIDALDDKAVRVALQDIDLADAISGVEMAEPKEPSRSIESNLLVPRSSSVYYSYSLILINVAVYILAVIKSAKVSGHLDWDATAVMQELALNQNAAGEWWRFFACGFLHFGIFHIAMNMYFLFVYGPKAESAFGRNRFLVLYLLSLFGCSMLSFAYHTAVGYPWLSAGASGALMGIFFGITGYVVAVRKVLGRGRVKELVRSSLIYAGILLLLGNCMGMDNAGHIGGGLTGFAVGYCFGLEDMRQPRWLVRLRYPALMLVMLAFGGLAALAWPRAQAQAKISVNKDEINAGVSQFDMANQALEEEIAAHKGGSRIYDEYDQLAGQWKIVRAYPWFNDPTDSPTDTALSRQEGDGDLAKHLTDIWNQDFSELQVETNDLIKAATGPHPPPAETVQTKINQLLARLTRLINWPPVKAMLADSAVLQREVDLLKQTLTDWQTNSAVPAPVPMPPAMPAPAPAPAPNTGNGVQF